MIGHTITNNRLKHIHKLINKLQQKNITPNNQIIHSTNGYKKYYHNQQTQLNKEKLDDRLHNYNKNNHQQFPINYSKQKSLINIIYYIFSTN